MVHVAVLKLDFALLCSKSLQISFWILRLLLVSQCPSLTSVYGIAIDQRRTQSRIMLLRNCKPLSVQEIMHLTNEEHWRGKSLITVAVFRLVSTHTLHIYTFWWVLIWFDIWQYLSVRVQMAFFSPAINESNQHLTCYLKLLNCRSRILSQK